MTIKVDLLPSEKRGFGLDPVLIVLLIIVVLCVVVFYFISAWFDSDIARKRDEVKQWDDKITLIKADIPKITKMREDNNRLQTQIEVIKSLSNDPERYANILYELGAILPPNMFVTQVNVDTGAYSVSIGGTAVSTSAAKPLESIARFMTDVANHSRYFKDATLSGTTATKIAGEGDGTGYTFTLELHYDPTRSTKAWNLVQPGNDAGTSATPAVPASTPTPAATTSATPGGKESTSASPSESPSGSGSPAPSGSDSPKAENSSSGSPSPAASK